MMDPKINAVKVLMKTFGITVEDLLGEDDLKPQETPAAPSPQKPVAYEPSEDEVVAAVQKYFAGIDGCRKLLQRLNISVTDLQRTEKSVEPAKPSADIKILTDKKSGLCYAQYAGKFIGVVLSAEKTGKFVFAAHNACPTGNKVDIYEAQKMLKEMSDVAGHYWIVPSDAHFMPVKQNFHAINDLLRRYGGDIITYGSVGFLSSTSQANKPSQWNVRFVLPLGRDFI